MASTLTVEPDSDEVPTNLGPDSHPTESRRNFAMMAAYQVLMRLGWIFKTESIIIPTVLDSLGGAAWLRGCLPLLNRIGHSIPPILASSKVAGLGKKRNSLAFCTAGMATSILLMGVVVASDVSTWWRPIAFLGLYLAFFCFTGVSQLSFGTLQGKLIATRKRGRLMMVANSLGGLVAITAAWWLMPMWLQANPPKFAYLFLFAGICFFATVITTFLLVEKEDQPIKKRQSISGQFAEAWQAATNDRSFRPLAIIAFLFGSSIMLFPHYQALARERLGLSLTSLPQWVIVQNIGTAVFSLVFGPIADRCGNRAVLRLCLTGLAIIPALALTMTYFPEFGKRFYVVVFAMIGLTPVAIRTLANFTLEVSNRSEHPRYLSTIALCMALPMCISPLAGWIIDISSFEIVFAAVAIAVWIAWILCWTIHEPRHNAAPASSKVELRSNPGDTS